MIRPTTIMWIRSQSSSSVPTFAWLLICRPISKHNNEQIHFTGQYYAIRQIQKDFLKARFKKKYREEHRTELDQYQEAVSFFREQCGGKVPVMKELKAEKEKLLTLQSEQRKELSGFDQMERELQTAVSNVDTILHPDTIPTRQKTKIQAER